MMAEVLPDLNHALARSMGGGGRVLELLDSWGRDLWGLSDTFSQPWSEKRGT